MSYEVLARRWRPGDFAEVVGQAHVLRALINALDGDRLHHAFLFTGTRGVGKTTLARILAKSINCDEGVSSTPCGQCATCREIDEGRYADLIEVDAASRTKVEDTRDLLENVQYAPTRGRFKVYLIDEVHMLSNHSFNALLKTLEEPPPHVKFLLATTDPQKLPVTILSRCLQFNLKRIPNDLIEKQIRQILTIDQINAEDEAIAEIAESADGSMRDALSLLDQAISYGAGELKTDDVREMLGTFDRQRIFSLIDKLVAADGSGLLNEVAQLAEIAPDFTALLHELNRRFQQIALLQQIPDATGPKAGERDRLLQFSRQIPAEDIQLYYQIGLAGIRDMPYVPDSRTGFEMVLIRMLVFQPAGKPVKKKLTEASVNTPGNSQPQAVELAKPHPVPTPELPPQAKPALATPEPEILTVDDEYADMPPAEWESYGEAFFAEASTSHPQTTIEPSVTKPVAAPVVTESEEDLPVLTEPLNFKGSPGDWHEWVSHLNISAMTRQLADHCEISSISANHIKLFVDQDYTHLNKPQWTSKLENALSEYLKGSVKLSVSVAELEQTPARKRDKKRAHEQQQAVESIHNDPMVQDIIETFDAVVLDGSIRPR